MPREAPVISTRIGSGSATDRSKFLTFYLFCVVHHAFFLSLELLNAYGIRHFPSLVRRLRDLDFGATQIIVVLSECEEEWVTVKATQNELRDILLEEQLLQYS